MNSRASMLGWRLTAVAVLAASVLVVGSAAASADQGISCGATITVDTKLKNDLSRCPGDGLLVSGDGVTLDLNGHTLRGSGSGSGITITGADVKVKNGSIQRFQQGVRVAGAHGNTTLTRLTVSRNGTGLVATSFGPGTVADSEFSGNALFGIQVRSGPAARWTVEDSRIARSGGDGIWYFDTPATLLRDQVTGNGGNGILVDSSDLSTLSGNDASRNGGNGILVRDSSVEVVRNTVRQNQGTGISLSECCGLLFAQHYLIADNTSESNGGFGILACTTIGSGGGCAPGMIDGGGNLAKRNQQTPECVNVVCRSSPRKG